MRPVQCQGLTKACVRCKLFSSHDYPEATTISSTGYCKFHICQRGVQCQGLTKACVRCKLCSSHDYHEGTTISSTGYCKFHIGQRGDRLRTPSPKRRRLASISAECAQASPPRPLTYKRSVGGDAHKLLKADRRVDIYANKHIIVSQTGFQVRQQLIEAGADGFVIIVKNVDACRGKLLADHIEMELVKAGVTIPSYAPGQLWRSNRKSSIGSGLERIHNKLLSNLADEVLACARNTFPNLKQLHQQFDGWMTTELRLTAPPHHLPLHEDCYHWKGCLLFVFSLGLSAVSVTQWGPDGTKLQISLNSGDCMIFDASSIPHGINLETNSSPLEGWLSDRRLAVMVRQSRG